MKRSARTTNRRGEAVIARSLPQRRRDNRARNSAANRRGNLARAARKPESGALELLLAIGQPPEQVKPALAEGLLHQWAEYREQLRLCQKEFSMRNLHQLRVQTRRLISRLALVEQIKSCPTAGKACRALKRRLKSLGDLRDTHVELKFVAAKRRQFSGLKRLRDYLCRRERRLTKPGHRKLQRFKRAKLARWVSNLAEKLEGPAADKHRAKVASATWTATDQAFHEVLRRRAAIDVSDLRTVHRTRIAFKRFRYTLECSPLPVLRPAPEMSQALAAYQRKMGNIQDTSVLLRTVKKFIRKHRRGGRKLGRFVDYLEKRRRQLLRVYLSSADELCDFWPPVPGDRRDRMIDGRAHSRGVGIS